MFTPYLTADLPGVGGRIKVQNADFCVREMPRVGQPLSPQLIAGELDLPTARVVELLDELEKAMNFLYRGDGENVTWAYPVTVDETPHHITFSTGEEVHAA